MSMRDHMDNGNKNGRIIAADETLLNHWREMRRYAIEIGLIAERQLIAMDAMAPEQRRVMTRKEARQKT